MSKTKHIKWLYAQLPDLLAKGVLTDDSIARLRKYYGEVDQKPAYDIAMILAAILGAVLIGGGIILLFAYNWDSFSKPLRAALSFAPLLIAQIIYGYVFFKKRNSTAWVEGSSVFLMLAVAACIALISQTYHIEGRFEDFLLIWMLLSIPLMYLLNSTLVTLFYLIGISSWAMDEPQSIAWIYWLLLLAALPHLIWNIYWKKQEVRAQLLGWVLVFSFTPVFFKLMPYGQNLINLVLSAVVLAAFYFIGQGIFEQRKHQLLKPFQLASVCLAFIMLMILGYDWPVELMDLRRASFPKNKIAFYLAAAIFLISYLYLSIDQWRKQKQINYFMFLLPLVTALGALLAHSVSERYAIVLANAYLFGFGIYYILQGIKQHRLSLVNLGMFFISALIVARFFDTDWSFMIKGTVFIILGLGFLWINVVLSKKLKHM